MKRIITVISSMIIVAMLSSLILAKGYSEISLQVRLMIIAGGAIVSGTLSYFLSRNDMESDN